MKSINYYWTSCKRNYSKKKTSIFMSKKKNELFAFQKKMNTCIFASLKDERRYFIRSTLNSYL